MLAEPGFHTRCWVEWEEHPRNTIIAGQRAGYFTPAPIWDDVTTFDGRPFRGAIDTILAGYPCQPFSAAGQRRGDTDERHLWPEVARIIREVDPEWVFLENVAGHVSLGLETVLRGLWGMGRTPAAGIFSAGETGAPHERQRVFIVAYRSSKRRQQDARGPSGDEEADGRAGRNKREPNGDHVSASGGEGMADASCPRPQGREQPGSTAERGCLPLFPPGPGDSAAWAGVLRVAPDLAPTLSVGDVKRLADHCAQMVAQGGGGGSGGSIPRLSSN
ncbi:DNA cytosine methyltransferase [Sediminimonas sp.]|uniref:DNA cytosine methyltransferase n=1 Tax=Sediminimonas sp. TaxID=2823379 RepID=UPI0025CDF4E5|nr:DNA cytosine methyltransferase [Sediminimonas sp.]